MERHPVQSKRKTTSWPIHRDSMDRFLYSQPCDYAALLSKKSRNSMQTARLHSFRQLPTANLLTTERQGTSWSWAPSDRRWAILDVKNRPPLIHFGLTVSEISKGPTTFNLWWPSQIYLWPTAAGVPNFAPAGLIKPGLHRSTVHVGMSQCQKKPPMKLMVNAGCTTASWQL